MKAMRKCNDEHSRSYYLLPLRQIHPLGGLDHEYWRRFPYLDIQFCPTRPTVADWRTLSMVVVRFKSRKPNHGP